MMDQWETVIGSQTLAVKGERVETKREEEGRRRTSRGTGGQGVGEGAILWR